MVVVSGHWPSATLDIVYTSGKAFLTQNPEMGWFSFTAQEVAVELHYRQEHAAGGETSLLIPIRPDLVDLSKSLETGSGLRPGYVGQPEHLRRQAETQHKHIGVCAEADDGHNDPELTASIEQGDLLSETIATRIAARARAALETRASTDKHGAHGAIPPVPR